MNYCIVGAEVNLANVEAVNTWPSIVSIIAYNSFPTMR